MRVQRNSIYFENVNNRSTFRFLLGAIVRIKIYLKFSLSRNIARYRGAKIGKNTNIPYKLAKMANENLIIGENTSIHSDKIDLRTKVKIGDNSIIGHNVEIITVSHNIDSCEYEHKFYGIEVSDYVWIATNVLILPSCRVIGKGAVVGAGSVVVKNVAEMSIVVGNPASHLRYRKELHSNLIVESLLGGDLVTYWKTRE